MRAVVLEHKEFRAHKDRVRRVFEAWRQVHAPRLRKLGVGDSPKTLMGDLSEDLLRRFAGLPLLDRYAVYQCLMDYWDEVMQDDVYLVVTEGWAEAARPRVLVPVRGKGAAETFRSDREAHEVPDGSAASGACRRPVLCDGARRG